MYLYYEFMDKKSEAYTMDESEMGGKNVLTLME